MRSKCPIISETLIIAHDPHLAAQLSCLLASPGSYLSILDAPRLQRLCLGRISGSHQGRSQNGCI
jgi:hypothetical protein